MSLRMFSFNTLTLLIAIVCLMGLKLVSAETAYCYAEDEDPYLLTGRKTPYHFSHGSMENSSMPNCEPMQIWMLSRHGTRYPSEKEIGDMLRYLQETRQLIVENHEKHGSGNLCQKDLENLKAWTLDPNLTIERSKHLTKQGEVDLETLGTRFKDYFPEFLRTKSHDEAAKKFKFRATSTQRTVSSMEYFMKGLLGDPSSVPSEVRPVSEDTLLKAYKTCTPWLNEMNKTYVNQEFQTFFNGTEMKKLISDVSRRIGFQDNMTLDVVFLMYKVCAFEKSWFVDKVSPWCAVFTKEELQVFEYEDDLFSYYHTGYGTKFSTAIGCVTLQDMFDHFTKIENGDTTEEPKGIFYFTHSASLQVLYTAMGIAKDTTPLTASNFRSMEDRKWRISFLSPFAVNLVAVFYKCDSAYKVRLYLSEKPLEFEGCDNGLCDWKYLKEKLGPVVSNCDVDSFCQRQAGPYHP